MSLDVYLDVPEPTPEHISIMIRENGQMRAITRAEWDEKFPDSEPIVVSTGSHVYKANITHNLGRMADEAGLYQALWRPDENSYEYAYQIIDVLETGLARLQSDPDHFKQFNPKNGWGDYDGLVMFVQRYLNACKQYPAAKVSASR